MGDGLKLCKDKRHRSSSSLAGVVVEGTRSERKIDIRASIPEVDDHFAIAEARCDDLQEKIDLMKLLKRKKKLKKRSTTRVAEAPTVADQVPFISVRTQPKKKVSQQAVRLRRLDVPSNPTRGYLDSATLEQRDMIGQVRGYNQMYRQLQDQYKNKQSHVDQRSPSRLQPSHRTRADGDGVCGQGVQISTNHSCQEVACGEDVLDDYSDSELFDRQQHEFVVPEKKRTGSHPAKNTRQGRGRNVTSRDTVARKTAPPVKRSEGKQEESHKKKRTEVYSAQRQRRATAGKQINTGYQAEDRPVVELFNKSRDSPSPTSWQPHSGQRASHNKKSAKVYEPQRYDDEQTGNLQDVAPPSPVKEKEVHRHPRRVKYRSRRYELPTVASQMKQAGMRCYYGSTNHTNIPFVVSKSTAPSHNIGVNIQQVLNGLKIQQPLSGIPLTIAHHMGLSHIPTHGTKSVIAVSPVDCLYYDRKGFSYIKQPSLDNHEMNAIRLGQRLVRLPSYKCAMSYNRLLALFREGDGMVPRFLRAISRPHYFYTSMYNLMTHREDMDGATSKGHAGSQEAKASLAEYASLYREYEQVDRCLQENYEPELERRKEILARQLAAREEHIRKVVDEYHASADGEPALRASASAADDAYRHSTFKLNSDETHP